jgi:cytochrome c oxidase subunit 2
VNKGWSILFGVTLLACFGLFVAAPFVGWWLPKNVSSYGDKVDALFYLILGITGFFFVLTEVLLVYFMFVYASRPGAKEHPVGHHYAEKKVFWTSYFKTIFRPVSTLLHDQHRVEMAWTIVPAAILLYIAFAQISTWQAIKDPASMPARPDQVMEVSARMFEWRMRYPNTIPTPKQLNKWSAEGEIDDVHVVNEVHVWQSTRESPCKVKVFLKTRDVIHSFYLPNLRLKQDALPGKTIPVWFEVTHDYNTVPVAQDGFPAAWVKDEDKKKNPPVAWVDGFNKDNEADARKIYRRAVKAGNTKRARRLRAEAKQLLFDNHEQIWELACAELCGWGHYKMRGKLYVHKDKEDYDRWLASARDQQLSTQPEK